MTGSLQAPRQECRPRRGGRRSLPGAVALALGIITALALALRLIGIDQSLYSDEDFTYYIVVRNDDLAGVWSDVYNTSITPPLHYFLAWLSVQFGGDSTVLVRIPSLVFGTALVPLVFVIARRIADSRAGLIAATLTALGPFAIWYSDEARTYALMMFLVALSTLALLRALDGGRRRWWVLYGLCACGALWSHYTAVFVIAVEAAWAIWVHRDRLRALLLAQTAIAVGYLPWLPGFISQRQNDYGIGVIDGASPVTIGSVVKVPLQTLIGHPFFPIGTLPGTAGAMLVAGLLALAALVALRTRALPRGLGPLLRSEIGLIALVALATPAGLLLYAASGTSLYLPRNLSASLPALVVLVSVLLGMASHALPRRLAYMAGAGVVVLLAINLSESLGDGFRRPPFREAAGYVERESSPGDVVLEIPPPLALDERLPKKTLDRYLGAAPPVYRPDIEIGPALRTLRSGRDVWAIAHTVLQGSETAKILLEEGERLPIGLSRRMDRLGGPGGRAFVREVRTFPGVFPVSALHYKGLVEGRLERRGGRQAISWSLGAPLLVSPGAARGEVQFVSPQNQPLRIFGWALDGVRPRLADWILLFSGDRLVAMTPGGSRRPDIAARFGQAALLSGFGFIPAPGVADRAALKVFAVVGDRASELPL